jgi:hypothetical protein
MTFTPHAYVTEQPHLAYALPLHIVVLLLLGRSIFGCLLSRVQSRVVTSVVPGHHNVLHVLVLHCIQLACHELSMFPRTEATVVKK